MSVSTVFKKGDKVTIYPIPVKVYIFWNRNFEPYTPQYPEGMDPLQFFSSLDFDGRTSISAPINGVIHEDEKSDKPIVIKVNNIFVHIPREFKDKIIHNMSGGRRKNRRGTKKARRNRRRASRRN
jgi:hypothetical protein